MGDDPYGLSVLGALGLMERGAADYYRNLSSAQMAAGWNNLAALGNALAPRDKLGEAKAYLRSRNLYCLDVKQGRIPPKECRHETCLDRWMNERKKGEAMKLYEYALIYRPLPTKDQKDRDEKPKPELVQDVVRIFAASDKEATMIAARTIPEKYADKLDRMEIAIRPF